MKFIVTVARRIEKTFGNRETKQQEEREKDPRE